MPIPQVLIEWLPGGPFAGEYYCWLEMLSLRRPPAWPGLSGASHRRLAAPLRAARGPWGSVASSADEFDIIHPCTRESREFGSRGSLVVGFSVNDLELQETECGWN